VVPSALPLFLLTRSRERQRVVPSLVPPFRHSLNRRPFDTLNLLTSSFRTAVFPVRPAYLLPQRPTRSVLLIRNIPVTRRDLNSSSPPRAA